LRLVHLVETTGLLDLIRQWVRQDRQDQRWTLDHLAEISGVNRRLLLSIKQGVPNPSIGILLMTSDPVGVGLAALVRQPRQAVVHGHLQRNGPRL
jgi:transcriptional regulator with XRE-family HTH domain